MRQKQQEALTRERIAAPSDLLKNSLSIVRNFYQHRKIPRYLRAQRVIDLRGYPHPELEINTAPGAAYYVRE